MSKSVSKYKAKKTFLDGILYDSKKEAAFASKLEMLKKAKPLSERVISFERQPIFDIVVNGQKICRYIADFEVTYADGRIEVIDVKGMKSGAAYQMFRLKKKLVEAVHGIIVIEV